MSDIEMQQHDLNSFQQHLERICKDLEDGDLGSWVIGFDTRHGGDTLERWPQKKVELEVINLIRQVKKLAV